MPQDVKNCLDANQGNPNVCQMAANNYVNAIVALRVADGSVAWSYKTGADVWTANITPDFAVARDWDFAQGPILFPIVQNGVTVDAVGAAGKSGIVWAMNRATGALIWSRNTGGSNSGGGMMW